MARPLKPLVRGGGYYPSNRWTPLVYPGGYTTANGGGQPEPEAVLKTVTGSLIHITDALALPAEALTVNVEPIQAGTGDPSPDNVRPISGRTSATIYHSDADTSDPTTYTIALGDTVYGGTLDVTAGKLTATMAMVDMGTIAFAKSSATSSSGGSVFAIPVSSVGLGMAERARYTPNNILSDVYKTASTSTWWISELPDLTMLINTNALTIADSRYSTAADFRAAMSGVQLCYELATPIEITLTPTQIEMLLGENNLWADAGDSTLTYYADGNASASEALGILLGGTYNNPGGADDVSDDEALEILLGGS